MPDDSHISLVDALASFKPVSLEEMDSVKLMNRVDSKYLTNEATLLEILGDAEKAGYRVLVTDGNRINPYDSMYFDTDDLRMFQDHRNGKLVRQKVRTRTYLSSGLAYLEIKRKNNKGRTNKKRTRIPVDEFSDFRRDSNADEYLARHSWFTKDDLSPVLETQFNRITLVNPAMTERVTIDTCLVFKNARNGITASLKNAVIIELKQDGRASSQMKEIFMAHRVKPVRVSKYCMAVTLTEPDARPGRFRLKVRKIEKIINQKITVK